MSDYLYIDGLPSEAVSVDGTYVENLISGYRTLKTTGRESLTREFEPFTVGNSDGDNVQKKRYPARTISVEFLITADGIEDMKSKLNHLNNILSADEADFVFNDEQDKFFTGVPKFTDSIEKGHGWITGTWQIYCPYPFKRSTAVFEATPTTINEHDAEFVINYNGTYPARPVLSAEFAGALSGGDYSDDGDCGYVVFSDDDENIIQLGNPDAIDLDAFTSAEQLINRNFSTIEDWTQSGGKVYEDKTVSGSSSVGNIPDTYWAGGTGQVLPFAKPAYGSGSGWHGPILWKSTAGAVNFDLNIVHRMCVSDVGQIGSFECGLYNVSGSTYRMVAGIVIEKAGSGTAGMLKYIIDDKVVESQSIDLSYYNSHFGYCYRVPVYKTQYYNTKTKKWADKQAKKKKYRGSTRKVVSGYTYTQSNLNTSIKKADSSITFKVGNMPAQTFVNTDVELVPVHNVSFHFGQNGSNAALHTNAVNSIRFSKNPSGTFLEIPNVFTAGDIVEADCNDASVYIKHANTEDGHYEPQYGALGNDWEDFSLQKGANYINAAWSPWVNESYKPSLKILYNEVYL